MSRLMWGWWGQPKFQCRMNVSLHGWEVGQQKFECRIKISHYMGGGRGLRTPCRILDLFEPTIEKKFSLRGAS